MQAFASRCGASKQVAGGAAAATTQRLIAAAPRRVLRTMSTSTTTTNAAAAAASASVQPCIIVGGGRVGQALAEMGPGNDVLVRRGGKIEGLSSGPIIVATRNDSLDGIVDATPEARRADLVFIQNGMLQPWLDSRGLGEDATQLLVYFAVAKLGDKPTDGVTDVNPEGLTAAHGRHAEAVAARLRKGGLSCKVLGRAEFTQAMLEKLVWICAFMAVGAKHKCNVGDVEAKHNAEVSALMSELLAAGGAALGVPEAPGAIPRLNAYARSVAHFPTAVKEFEWRNGWFHGLSRAAAEAGKADPCPLHTAILKEVGAI